MRKLREYCEHTECDGYEVDEMFNERYRCDCLCHPTTRHRALAWWCREHGHRMVSGSCRRCGVPDREVRAG